MKKAITILVTEEELDIIEQKKIVAGFKQIEEYIVSASILFPIHKSFEIISDMEN